MSVERLSGQKILVTGGKGFIGRHLVNRLKLVGAEVSIFDINGQNSEYGDIRDYKQVLKAVEGHDFVCHMAATVGVDEALENPAQVMDVNLTGTVNVLKAMRATGVNRIIFASSSEVYGDREIMKETDVIAPLSIYGLAKGCAESYCWSYWHDFGVEATMLRFFNVYGEWQRQSFVIPKFLDNIKHDERPLIIGDGKQVRCYTHISDAIDGVISAMVTKEAVGEIFNIGNNVETSVLELAMFMIKESGKDIKPQFREKHREYEIMHRKPDITKANVILGFNPVVPWKDGVRRLIKNEISD